MAKPEAVNTQIRKIADYIERHTNKNNLGHGEHACQFCDARGQTNVEHTDVCPIGQLRQLGIER